MPRAAPAGAPHPSRHYHAQRTTHPAPPLRTPHPAPPLRTTHHAPVLRTHRLSSLFEAQRVAVLRPIDTDPIALGVLSLEYRHGQRILEQPLNCPLERPCAVDWIVPLRHEQLLRRRCNLDRDLVVG